MTRVRVVRHSRPAVAYPVRVARERRPSAARKWRRRGRRAQVSAVATIFGLLLVVTFIANYLSATLPNEMSVNDLNHNVQVENQLAHLQALLQRVSSTGVVGAPALQPVSLGSASLPPFAPADGGSVLPIPGEPAARSSFSIVSTHYAPPTGWISGGTYDPSCTPSPPPPANATGFRCSGTGHVKYNFTGASSYSVTGPGGAYFFVNYSTNHSLINVAETGNGGGLEAVEIVGSYNTAYVSATGGANQNVTIVGNWNNVTINATSGAYVRVLIVGNHDHVTVSNVPGSSNSVLVVGWGQYDVFTPGQGGSYGVYFIGFDHQAPTSPICPYDDLALTDNVTSPPNLHGTYHVTYNQTRLNGTTTKFTPWTTTYNAPVPSACVFFPRASAGGLSASAATLVVQLHNTYAPPAEVAFDQGAIVFAQSGGYPILYEAPPITFAYGTATLWVPVFLAPIPSVSGAGTAAVSFRLVSVLSFNEPSNGWIVNPQRPLALVYTTPYASAWATYFAGIPTFAGHVTCAPSTSAACVGPYEPGGPLGTVSITLPATAISVQYALFSVSVS